MPLKQTDKYGLLFTLITILLSVNLACSGSDGEQPISSEAKNNEPNIEETVAAAVAATQEASRASDTANTDNNSDDSAATATAESVEEPSQTSDDLAFWVDTYTLEEVDISGTLLQYTVTVYEENGELMADIDVDGLQTMTRLKAKGDVVQGALDLYLTEYRPDNMFEQYAIGDWLLSFEYDEDELYYYWGVMDPMVEVDDSLEVYPQSDQPPNPDNLNPSQTTGYLPLGGEVDVDGNGVADFWSDSGGIATRSAESMFETYEEVGFASCKDEFYHDDIPHDPKGYQTHCFKTDQEFVGKFKVINQDDNGGLTFQYIIWNAPNTNTLPPPPAPNNNQSSSSDNPPYQATIGSPSYEQWGRPTSADGCNGPYNDLEPIKRFTLEIYLTNNTDTAVPQNWSPVFITDSGKQTPACIWNSQGVPPGQTNQSKFATHMGLNEWVTAISIGDESNFITVCLNQAGAEIPCE